MRQYNRRSEVSEATIAGNHAYDLIGNSTFAAVNGMTNTYTANNLNQYTSILRDSVPPCEPGYDADGNMTEYSPWTYTYDANSRLVTVSSNGILLVTNAYDAKGRRVKKVTPSGTHVVVYDDWNLIYERVDKVDGTTDEFHYVWGKDLSGTLQGAGGVGGLLYVKYNGTIYVPHADAYGNIMRYTDTAGNVVAEYTYDAFGRTIAQTGPLVNVFRHRFSSKYFDVETGLYYYGYRFYSSGLRRWITKDPIGEKGGLNLYTFCVNNPISNFDVKGRDIRVEKQGRKIIVVLNITIYYANRIELRANTNLERIAGRIKRQIESQWNTQEWTLGCCTVSFRADVSFRQQVGTADLTGDNLVSITTDSNYRSNVIGDNFGMWSANNRPGTDWAFAHEAGHLMGLDDDYVDDANGNSIPNPGHEGHMMGQYQGIVQEHEVMDIIRKNNISCDVTQ